MQGTNLMLRYQNGWARHLTVPWLINRTFTATLESKNKTHHFVVILSSVLSGLAPLCWNNIRLTFCHAGLPHLVENHLLASVLKLRQARQSSALAKRTKSDEASGTFGGNELGDASEALAQAVIVFLYPLPLVPSYVLPLINSDFHSPDALAGIQSRRRGRWWFRAQISPPSVPNWIQFITYCVLVLYSFTVPSSPLDSALSWLSCSMYQTL